MFNRSACPRFPAALVVLLLIGAGFAAAPAAAHDIDHGHHPAARDAAPQADASAALKRFRETGDDRHLDAGWRAIQPALNGGTPDATVLVHAAALAQARHEFDEALTLIDRAVEQQPNLEAAWLLRAAVLLVRGDADAAGHACRRLRSSPALLTLTCHARVGIARGENARSLQTLSATLAAVNRDAAEPDHLAWALSVAGDAAASIDPVRAADYYRDSLAIAERTQVRAAWVDLLLHDARYDDARDALAAGSDALPLEIRRMILARRTGEHARLALRIAAADHEFRHWLAAGDLLHAREMARFYLDVLPRPELAKRLATENLRMQREPEDLRLATRVSAR